MCTIYIYIYIYTYIHAYARMMHGLHEERHQHWSRGPRRTCWLETFKKDSLRSHMTRNSYIHTCMHTYIHISMHGSVHGHLCVYVCMHTHAPLMQVSWRQALGSWKTALAEPSTWRLPGVSAASRSPPRAAWMSPCIRQPETRTCMYLTLLYMSHMYVYKHSNKSGYEWK